MNLAPVRQTDIAIMCVSAHGFPGTAISCYTKLKISLSLPLSVCVCIVCNVEFAHICPLQNRPCVAILFCAARVCFLAFLRE